MEVLVSRWCVAVSRHCKFRSYHGGSLVLCLFRGYLGDGALLMSFWCGGASVSQWCFGEWCFEGVLIVSRCCPGGVWCLGGIFFLSWCICPYQIGVTSRNAKPSFGVVCPVYLRWKSQPYRPSFPNWTPFETSDFQSQTSLSFQQWAAVAVSLKRRPSKQVMDWLDESWTSSNLASFFGAALINRLADAKPAWTEDSVRGELESWVVARGHIFLFSLLYWFLGTSV